MINQAEIRSSYARTRCALMQSQDDFRGLLRDLLEWTRNERSDAEPAVGLRRALEDQRLALRAHLHDLTELREKAQIFPGLLDRAIQDARRLFEEQQTRR